ncbi:hypothetical protein B0A49_01174 [Cryomyces minteri]|uniref:Protein kinase domain-containing protein n=1 Tax=Cryomyces minteri TaxID=331657 RepID=A0A4V5NGX1_9PEZI|nr:hypothetical protein B0A49_01174 [Cryomyces minteri]
MPWSKLSTYNASGTHTWCSWYAAISLGPAADYNLEELMGMCEDRHAAGPEKTSLLGFPSCLLSTIVFIHDQRVRHNDVKPKNILVRSTGNPTEPYRVYIADFGIARSYKSHEDMETDGAIAFTRSYCAPEVAEQRKRARKADIFSLGCVFSEMVTVLANKTVEEFKSAREEGCNDCSDEDNSQNKCPHNKGGDTAFHATLPLVPC